MPSSTLNSQTLKNATTPNTTKQPDNNGNKRSLIIGCTIGGIILLVVVTLFCLYCWKKNSFKRERNQKHSSNSISHQSTLPPQLTNGTSLVQSSQTGFCYSNPTLLSSDQDIEVGISHERRSTLILEPVDVEPPGVQLGPIHGINEDLKETSHDVSIKLMTPWDEIYNKVESKGYKQMKTLVEDSIEELYMNFSDFRGATLQRFRQGSVIAEVRMKFVCSAKDPLDLIKKAVKTGQCAQLQVDRKFYAEQLVTDVISKPSLYSSLKDSSNKEEASCTASSRPRRMESGYHSQYGSQNFDQNALLERLKVRESSQRSTTSIESNTSEIGTSHSVSPNSCSSTNISIHSAADDEPPKREKSLLGIIAKKNQREKQKVELSIPHIALFNFSPQDFRELALTQNELITVTVVDPGGWVKATNKGGKRGWVPQNFVQPIDLKKYADAKATVDSLMVLDDVIDSIDITFGDDANVDVIYDEPKHYRKSTSSVDHVYDQPADGVSISGLFVAIYPSNPTETNELKLEIGDLVDVLKTSETGWWKGRCLRTSDDGWFPSHYVRPHTSDLDFRKYLLEDEIEDKGSVSDSEIHVRALSFPKEKKQRDGYSSDDGSRRHFERIENGLRTTSLSRIKNKPNSISQSSSHGAIVPTHLSQTDHPVKRESDVKEGVAVDIEGVVVDIEGVAVDIEPPCKPVPPKPRKSHLIHTYRDLASKGKLGSTDSLVTRSTECLASYDAARTFHVRRNSEELAAGNDQIGRANMKPIDRLRPRSFQENPKSSFFYLANRYASSMKAAWSFPTLVGDQVNLSPDDERPYLVPIPRKSRRKSSPPNAINDDNIKMADDTPKSSAADRHVDEIDRTEHSVDYSTKKDDGYKSHCAPPPPKPVRRSSSDCSIDLPLARKVCVKIPTGDSASPNVSVKSLSAEVKVGSTLTEPLVKMEKPVIAPKPSTSGNVAEVLKNNKIPPMVGPKPPPAPKRTSSKNITQKFIEGHLTRSSENLNTSPTRTADTHNRHVARNRNHFHFTSFGPINEESEQSNNNLSAALGDLSKPPNHRRYYSEPYDVSHYLNTNQHQPHETFLYNPPILMHHPEPSDHASPRTISPNSEASTTPEELFSPTHLTNKLVDFSSSSRASSMQSLNSIGSARSTSSTKHEQMNLRKAVMDVYGQGPNDLSFKAGSILYELRPRNKEGYCYGLLEDSTQGFYPHTAVQSFQDAPS